LSDIVKHHFLQIFYEKTPTQERERFLFNYSSSSFLLEREAIAVRTASAMSVIGSVTSFTPVVGASPDAVTLLDELLPDEELVEPDELEPPELLLTILFVEPPLDEPELFVALSGLASSIITISLSSSPFLSNTFPSTILNVIFDAL
jgi:hypothetical protein